MVTEHRRCNPRDASIRISYHVMRVSAMKLYWPIRIRILHMRELFEISLAIRGDSL